MQVKLTNPELTTFIEDQVKTGSFPSPEAAIEAAIERMMLDEVELDDDTVAAIQRAEAQFERGEGIDFKQFAAEMRKRLQAR